jgi:PadR family transcriptional regulator, regulatory protein PadR
MLHLPIYLKITHEDLKMSLSASMLLSLISLSPISIKKIMTNSKLTTASIFEPVNLLQIQVLSAVSGQERYGLEIVKVFEKASLGTRTIKLSTLYTVLARLEKSELITSRSEGIRTDGKGGGQRKYFQITKEGRLLLANQEVFLHNIAGYQIQPA